MTLSHHRRITGPRRPRRQAFSLVELAVVIVIVGVLAAFGVPRYRDSVERTKAAEAFQFLSAIRSAQERHIALHGQYATSTADLDIQVDLPKYFDVPGSIDRTLGEVGVDPDWSVTVTRKAATSSYGAYTIVFDEGGFQGDSTIPPQISPIEIPDP